LLVKVGSADCRITYCKLTTNQILMHS